MADYIETLIDWCRKELDAAEQQVELFGAKGAKAMLALADGTRQDITARVLEHQMDAVARLPVLIGALESARRRDA